MSQVAVAETRAAVRLPFALPRQLVDNSGVETVLVAALIGCVSLLYATVGQSGGTAFLAIMAMAGFAAHELRPTALLLNIVAASYSTWRSYPADTLDRRLLLQLTIPSLVTALLGGMLVLGSTAYYLLTGLLLIAAAVAMVISHAADTTPANPVRPLPAALVGAAAGFGAGLTGIGGGVFLTPALVVLGWASPRRAAGLSPPFILANSALGLLGVLLAGQTPAPDTGAYAVAALLGAVGGMAIGGRWMSQRATRLLLAAIVLAAGIRLLVR